MRRIVAPERAQWTGPSVFLAGGITGCPEWQDRAAEVLEEERKRLREAQA